LVAGISLTALAIVFHQVIFWYLNIDYSNDFWVLFILALGIIGFTVYDIFGINYFLIRRQDKLVMRNTIYVSVIGLVLAFPLINLWGNIGAAINLSLARILMGIGLGRKYIQENRNEI